VYLANFGCIIFDFLIFKYNFFITSFTNFFTFDLSYLKLSLVHFKKFIKFNYHVFNYSRFTVSKSINKLAMRFKSAKPIHTNFLGFKIKCSGRFSRKQRASSYWFLLGSVPLNSTNAYIEYATHTVFLANSSVTIKV